MHATPPGLAEALSTTPVHADKLRALDMAIAHMERALVLLCEERRKHLPTVSDGTDEESATEHEALDTSG